MSVGLKGNADGSGAIQVGGSDAITITTGLNTTFAGTVTSASTIVAATGTLYPLVSGTAVASTSGTSIDFTNIPSWVKRVTVMLNGVSTSGTSVTQIQLGTSGGVVSSGYDSRIYSFTGGSQGTSVTSGFVLEATAAAAAANVRIGAIYLLNISGNNWVATGSQSQITTNGAQSWINGSIALSSALTTVRLTTANGTDTFDAGSINIFYE
jgi:hypothetical protein